MISLTIIILYHDSSKNVVYNEKKSTKLYVAAEMYFYDFIRPVSV